MKPISSSRLLAVSATLAVIVSAIAVGLLAAPARAATSYPSPLVIRSGSQAGEAFGQSLAVLDINGDGVADLAVGAPSATAGALGQTGAVFLYLSGPNGSGGIKPFASVFQLNGSAAGDRFGQSVAAVGDVNHDGVPDLAVGSPLASPSSTLANAGTVTIFEGAKSFNQANNVTLQGLAAGDEFGYSIAAGGDINLDTFSDFLVGAPYCDAGATADVGCAYVFYGSATLSSSTVPSITFTGTTGKGHMGWSIAGGVNVDKDNTLDMVVGAPDQGAAGSVYIIRNINLVSPGPAINVLGGKNAGDRFGTAVAMLPDLNGDGFGDVAIGAPFNADGGAGAGEVSVIYGSTKFNTAVDLTYMGQADEEFGASLAAGDVHEDGFSDLLVGAPASSLNVTSGGRAYLFDGASIPGTTANLTLVPVSADGAGLFGSSVTTGGNFTAGHDFDFAVGSPQATVSGMFYVGRAYAYSGVKVPTITAPTVSGNVCIPFSNPCQGLASFVVTLENAGLTKTFTTLAGGAFSFGPVPAGTYFLNATHAGGYVDNSSSVTLAVNKAYSFNIYPFTIPLTMGVIKDRLNDSFVNGVTVRMYSGTALINASTTGPSGQFSMYVPDAYIPALGHSVNVTLSFFDPTHYTNTTGKITLKRNETNTSTLFLNRFPFAFGVVRDALTLATIRSATIQVTQGPSVLATATTNNQGVYSLWVVNATVPARAFFNVTATGYARVSTQLTVDKNNRYPLNFTMFVDRVAPTSALNALGTYSTTATFPISGTDSDPGDGVAQVQLYYKSNNTGSFILYGGISNPGASFTFSFNSTAVRGDAYYQFYTIATDYAANVQGAPATNATWTLVDTMKPTSSLAALPAYENKANFTLSATAYDSNGIHNVTLWYRIGTTGAFHYVADATTAPYGFWFNTTKLGTGDGVYQFYSIATDKAGNMETTPASADTVTTVDTTSPTVAFTAPAANAWVNATSVTFTISAADSGSGLSSVSIALDGGAPTAVTGTTYTATGLSDGNHTALLTATDKAGNVATASRTIKVDTSKPSVAISSPSAGATLNSKDVTVSWTQSDAGSGVADVKISVDGGAFQDLGTATTDTLSGLSDGSHTVVIKVVDAVGNSQTATVTFTVSTAPTTGAGLNPLLIGGVVVVIVVVAVVAAVLMRRRGAKPPAEKPAEEEIQKPETPPPPPSG